MMIQLNLLGRWASRSTVSRVVNCHGDHGNCISVKHWMAELKRRGCRRKVHSFGGRDRGRLNQKVDRRILGRFSGIAVDQLRENSINGAVGWTDYG